MHYSTEKYNHWISKLLQLWSAGWIVQIRRILSWHKCIAMSSKVLVFLTTFIPIQSPTNITISSFFQWADQWYDAETFFCGNFLTKFYIKLPYTKWEKNGAAQCVHMITKELIGEWHHPLLSDKLWMTRHVCDVRRKPWSTTHNPKKFRDSHPRLKRNRDGINIEKHNLCSAAISI